MGGIGFGSAESGWKDDGTHVAKVGGPGGGGRGGGFRGGGGGGGMEMYQAMMQEAFDQKMRGARTRDKAARYDLTERKRSDRRARAPKMAGGKLKHAPMDPMRYGNQARTAARNAQFSQGGYGTYGQGRMSMAQEGDKGFESAMAAYPSYFQSMMASGMM